MRFAALPSLDHPLVALRPLAERDIEPWYAILSQPEVFEHTSWNLAAADELRPYVEVQRVPTDSSLLRLAIARRADDALVGTIGFHTVSPANRTAEMAYELAPEVWGLGIARTTCEALARWAFEDVGLVRVQATTLVANTRSQRVLEACGFQREGLLRRYRIVRSVSGDFWMYSRLA